MSIFVCIDKTIDHNTQLKPCPFFRIAIKLTLLLSGQIAHAHQLFSTSISTYRHQTLGTVFHIQSQLLSCSFVEMVNCSFVHFVIPTVREKKQQQKCQSQLFNLRFNILLNLLLSSSHTATFLQVNTASHSNTNVLKSDSPTIALISTPPSSITMSSATSSILHRSIIRRRITHFCNPNSISMFQLKILTVFIKDSNSISFFTQLFR